MSRPTCTWNENEGQYACAEEAVVSLNDKPYCAKHASWRWIEIGKVEIDRAMREKKRWSRPARLASRRGCRRDGWDLVI